MLRNLALILFIMTFLFLQIDVFITYLNDRTIAYA